MNLHRPATRPKARKEHRCTFCGGPIPVGEQYTQQSGFYEGKPYRNRYHDECFETLAEEGEFEFTPYSGEYPDRVKALMDARIA